MATRFRNRVKRFSKALPRASGDPPAKPLPVCRILLEHHRAINDAIQARDPDAAREAVNIHLTFVEDALDLQNKIAKNEEIAKLRYAHEQDR